MRYSPYDVSEFEDSAAVEPGASGSDVTDGDAADGGADMTADDAGGDAPADEPPPPAPIEPPLWRTADDNILHLPPGLVERIRAIRVGAPPPLGGRRRPHRFRPRVYRRRTINTMGRLARGARRIGVRRVGAARLPVFRSRLGAQRFRIIARPRNGLRHEIVGIEPELGFRSEIAEEYEGAIALPEPIKTAVPFAPLPSSGAFWPVKTTHAQARVVSYRTAANKTVGREGRRFMAARKGTRNGVSTARNHAGIDLFAKRGDPVIACEPGTIVHYGFFYKAKSGQRTFHILVEHPGAVVNYGEVRPDSFDKTELKVGMPVRAGQVIGYVSDTDMLHFEMYTRGSKSAARWWKGDPPPSRLLDPTRYLLQLVMTGVSAQGTVAPTKAPAPAPAVTPKAPMAPTPAAPTGDVARALRIAKTPVKELPGTTIETLIERWRQRICPEIPRQVLIAFVLYESGGRFSDATHGTKDNGWTVPAFYELGIFQTPAGLHGPCTGAAASTCRNLPPGQEGSSPSTWVRLCKKIGADPKGWTNPTTQVRVGLLDLEEGAQALRKAFPDLFKTPGSDWDVRMAVLYRFARGGGYARSFLSGFRSQLAAMPEAQRWTFLRDKSVTVSVVKAGKRVPVKRTFKGENVEKKMALAAKLGYAPGAGGQQP